MAHTFNLSTWEAEAGGFLSSRLAWSTECVPGQPGLHRETLSQNTKKKKKKKKRKEKEIDKTRPSSKGKCNFRRLDQAVMVNLEHKGRRNS